MALRSPETVLLIILCSSLPAGGSIPFTNEQGVMTDCSVDAASGTFLSHVAIAVILMTFLVPAAINTMLNVVYRCGNS